MESMTFQWRGILVRVEGDFTEGRPMIAYHSNGDPGDPGYPACFEVDRVWAVDPEDESKEVEITDFVCECDFPITIPGTLHQHHKDSWQELIDEATDNYESDDYPEMDFDREDEDE